MNHMKIQYRNTLETVFQLEKPFFILINDNLEILLCSESLIRHLNTKPDSVYTIQDIFQTNDLNIIISRIKNNEQLGKPLIVSLHKQDNKYRVIINAVLNNEENHYIMTIEEIEPLFSQKNINSNFEGLTDLFNSLFSQVPYGVILFSKTHKIIYINKWFQNFSGFSYSEISTYDDLVKKLNIQQIHNIENQYIKYWNIANQDKLSYDFTVLYTFLQDSIYLIFLIPSDAGKLKTDLTPFNMTYLTIYNLTIRKVNYYINKIRSIMEDSENIKNDNNYILSFFQDIIKDANFLSSLQTSLLSNKYYNFNKKLLSLISLMPESVSENFTIEAKKEMGFITYYSEQLDIFLSIILDDISSIMKEGNCRVIIDMEDDDTNLIIFSVNREIDLHRSLIFTDKDTPIIKYKNSLLELLQGKDMFQKDREGNYNYIIKLFKKRSNLLINTPDPDIKKDAIGVLIADDEESVRETSRTMLEMMGFSTFLANNGDEAIKIFKDNFYDISIIVLDLIMPKLDGHQTYRILKALKPDLKVLLISGYYTESILKNFLKDNNTAYILKPFTIEQLKEKIEELINN